MPNNRGEIAEHLSRGRSKIAATVAPSPARGRDEIEEQTPRARDELPDYFERLRRIADLSHAPALPIADIALILDLPLSTIDKLRAQGKGPKCFRIGRRLYVRQCDFREWLDSMAASEAA